MESKQKHLKMNGEIKSVNDVTNALIREMGMSRIEIPRI